jgi:hypothetical protein
MIEEYIAKIGINGILEIDPGIIKKILGKQVKIIVYPDREPQQERNRNRFFELLEKGPKAEGITDNITREWIYSRDDDEELH